MKRIFVLFFAVICLTGCGVGTHSIHSGVEDASFIFFTDDDRYPITVFIDDVEYNVETVKTRLYKADRKIRKTVENTIKVAPGQHDVRVVVEGNQVFGKKLFLSVSETKNIQL